MLKLEPNIALIDGEPDPQLSENALRVLEKRYLRKDETGKVIETPRQLFWRVAWNLAQADAYYGATPERVEERAKAFYRMIAALEFLPNSPTLMNAGLDLQQLSACFVIPVEDSLAGIFQTLKESALIHQSGGGCVAARSHVFTTFCGVERIETLYDRVRALGVPEGVRGDHRVMDVTALGVQTFAVDPATGRFAMRPVTHLWQWDVPAESQLRVRCSDGTEITTSEWHPFLILAENGVAERRADALQSGDVLLAPNGTVRATWPFTRPLEQEGFVLDERVAWLTGFFLGDGSLGWFQNKGTGYRALRLRLFDGRPENILFARAVLAEHGVSVSPQQDRRGLWSLTTTDANFVPRFARIAGAVPGPKEALTLPEWVAKSPLPVVAAFLGGLLDSDGYVSLDRRRLEYSTVCPTLATKLVSLLSALGFNPSIRERAPRGRAKHVEYRLHMADAKKTPELVGFLRPWVHDPLRVSRMESLVERLAHNTHRRIPVPFALLEKLLRSAGVPTRSTEIHRNAVNVGGERFWLHRAKWDEGIGEDKLRRLVRALRTIVPESHREVLDQLECLADGWTTVASVEGVADSQPFYDFTVAGFNNYLAGGGLGKMAVVHNTGFGFSRLRPKNDFVRSTMGVASGPVSFMKVFDAATQQVKQGSKRRGANMGILRVDHPDILEFITCKDDIREITNFNISVAVTDRFMEAVAKGEKYDLVNPRNGKVAGQLDAREVFEKIAHQAWKNGEPGLFFIDETNRRQSCNHVGMMEATNPCGEQPLLPYESCNLGSINLEKHMVRGKDGTWDVDWTKLERTIRTSVRMLDNVIDMNAYPVKQIEEMTKATRKIGLGVMGFARMLFALEVPYDSKEGVEWGRRVMQFIQETGYDESARLAVERGVYPAWEGSAHWKAGQRVRNSYVTTVAPTGTLSMIADTSGGCEPEFSLIWFKRVMGGEQLPYSLEYFEDVARREGFWTPDLVKRVLDNQGRARGLKGVPEKWQRVFAVSFDVSPEWHVRMQAAFQDSCDAAVSKTINLPREATVEDVTKAYLLAFELKCKGITVYRDGSREDQVLNVGVVDAEKGKAAKPEAAARAEAPAPPVPTRPRPRPDTIQGRTQKILTGYGPLYVTINEDDKGLFELFAQIGRGGGYTASFSEAVGRLVSLCLRSGVPVDEIIDQLEGIRSPRLALDHGERIFSIPDAVAKAIKRHIGAQKTGVMPPIDSYDAEVGSVHVDEEFEKEAQAPEIVKRGLNPECPECGRTLILEEGCAKCRHCGYSEC